MSKLIGPALKEITVNRVKSMQITDFFQVQK